MSAFWKRNSSWCMAFVTLAAHSPVSSLAQTSATSAQVTTSESVAGIREATERLLRALDDLDWESFRTSWAQRPTAFLPFDDTPDGVVGRQDVESRWRRFFDETRASRSGPPYLNLRPLGLQIERFGSVGLVIFTLELTIGGRRLPLQRRTLVFTQESGSWKLVHMHASGAPSHESDTGNRASFRATPIRGAGRQ
jgi:ketosteroid isomerase-like protein